MGRLRLAAVECNSKEVDRKLKEQFVHGFSDNDMLAEIIRELTKARESADITSEQVLGWKKRVEAKRAQSAIMDSLTKTKEFDKVKIAKGELRYNGTNVQTCAKTPAKKRCSYCSSSHTPCQYLIYEKKCADCGKINHFRKVCSSKRTTTVHNIEQEPDHCNIEKDYINMVNINLIIFNSELLAITANLKTPLSQVSIIIPYRVETGSDGNIMSLHLYKRCFLGQQKNNCQQPKLKTFN